MGMTLWSGMLLTAVSACGTCRIDWDAVKSENRLLRGKVPAAPVLGTGSCELRYEDKRLLLDVVGALGSKTEFILDTGGFANWASACSHLAQEMRVSDKLNASLGAHTGKTAVADAIALGTIEAKQVVIPLLEARHRRTCPINIIGLPIVSRLVLRHDAPSRRWVLLSRGAWPGGSSAALKVNLAVKDIPMVRLKSIDGREAYGLIDTGAPETYAFPAWRGVSLFVMSSDGTKALQLEAKKELSGPQPVFGGIRVDVLIGLDVLSRRTWALDVQGGHWMIEP